MNAWTVELAEVAGDLERFSGSLKTAQQEGVKEELSTRRFMEETTGLHVAFP